MIMFGWKAFRNEKDGLHFLFRGHEGSTRVPLRTWLTAKAKLVRDGKGRNYRAGFHFMVNWYDAQKFDRLTKGKYVFRMVEIRGARPKPGSRTGIWLARGIFVHEG